MREHAVQLCLVMCEVWGESLDRLTLWDRIDSGMKAAAAKCQGGDTERFAALCLDHVRADTARAACNELFVGWLMFMDGVDDAFRQRFVAYCGSMSAVVCVHARRAWQDRMATRVPSAKPPARVPVAAEGPGAA